MPRRCGLDNRRPRTMALVRGCHLGAGLDGADASGWRVGRWPARAAREVRPVGAGSAGGGRHAFSPVRAGGVTAVLRRRSLPLPRPRCRCSHRRRDPPAGLCRGNCQPAGLGGDGRAGGAVECGAGRRAGDRFSAMERAHRETLCAVGGHDAPPAWRPGANAEGGGSDAGGVRRSGARRGGGISPQTGAPHRRSGAGADAVQHCGRSEEGCWRSIRVLLEYRAAVPHLEIAVGDRLLVDGPWHWQASKGGRPLEMEGPWSVSCWESDKKATYLEIIAPLAGGMQIDRQIVLLPRDRVVLLADAITHPAGDHADGAGSEPRWSRADGMLRVESVVPLAASLA